MLEVVRASSRMVPICPQHWSMARCSATSACPTVGEKVPGSVDAGSSCRDVRLLRRDLGVASDLYAFQPISVKWAAVATLLAALAWAKHRGIPYPDQKS